MKKVLALILASVMLVGLVACGNNATKPSSLDIKLEMQEVEQVNPVTGVTLKDELIISPMKSEQFNHETIAAEIQKLDFAKNWYVKTQYTEKGLPYFTDNGQLTAFMSANTVSLYECNPDAEAIGRSVHITYTVHTDVTEGYAAVAVSFENGMDDKAIADADVQAVLKAVYGEEYAQYLYNGKMSKYDDEEERYTFATDYAALTFRRENSEYGKEYAMELANNNSKQTYGYAGDFQYHTELFQHVQNLLVWNMNDTVLDIPNMGAEFLAKHYGEDTHLTVGTSILDTMNGAYLYQEADMKALMLRYKLAQPGVDANDQLGFTITVSETDKGIEMYLSLDIGKIAKENVNDETKAALYQQTLQMVRDILFVGEEFELGEVQYVDFSFDGTPAYAGIRYDCTPDELGNEKAVLTIGVSTDMSSKPAETPAE